MSIYGQSWGGRYRSSILRFRTVLLVITVLSPIWVMPLSSPVVSDVVIVMHHDCAISMAIQTITENLPYVQVVEYGSLEYYLMIHRTIGRVIWVSHGSEDGILAYEKIISWQAFSRITTMTPGKDIILACYSAEINKYVPMTESVGFNGFIDAVLGGLLTAFILEPSSLLFSTAVARVMDLIDCVARPFPLGIVYGVHSFNLNGYGGSIMYKRLTPYSYSSYYCSGTGTVSNWPGIPILNTGIAIHSHGIDYVYWVLDFGGLNYFGRTHSDIYLKEMVGYYIIISIIATALTYIPVGLAAHAAIALAGGLVPVVSAVIQALLPSIAFYIITLFNEVIFQANPEGLAACILLGAFEVLSLSLGDTLAAFVVLYAGLNGIGL
ncbi:MAG: hypothetical protein P1Q69_07800 [Candidatus Thorarchaeota archaeon]|nr:hypothetical protein [Candidatus Thorarchaeota archaeon]